MKRFVTILFLSMAMYACHEDDESFIVGIWKIDGVGTLDTTAVQEKLLGYALLNMQSVGANWEFTKDGTFKIYYQNNPPFAKGEYAVISDGEYLILKIGNKEERYDYKIIKKSNTQIQLKSTKTKVVINLTKK